MQSTPELPALDRLFFPKSFGSDAGVFGFGRGKKVIAQRNGDFCIG